MNDNKKSQTLSIVAIALLAFAIIASLVKLRNDTAARQNSRAESSVAPIDANSTAVSNENEAETEAELSIRTAIKMAHEEFFVDHTWDGTLKQIGDHIVSVNDDGRFWCDCLEVTVDPYAPPWDVDMLVLKAVSNRLDIYARPYHAQEIQIYHYHHGDHIETLTADNPVPSTPDAPDLTPYFYKLTDEDAVTDQPNHQKGVYLAEMLPTDADTQSYVALARDAYRQGWDGSFRELANGVWARIGWGGRIIFNNDATSGHLCLPATVVDSYYFDNVQCSTGVTDNKTYPALSYIDDDTLYVYTIDDQPLVYQLPYSGIHKIIAADFSWDDFYQKEDQRSFTLAVETYEDNDNVRLDLVYGNLDDKSFIDSSGHASHCSTSKLAASERGGAKKVDGDIVYSTSTQLCIVSYWDRFPMNPSITHSDYYK